MLDNIRRFAVVSNTKTGKKEFIASPKGGNGNRGRTIDRNNRNLGAVFRNEEVIADFGGGSGGTGAGGGAYDSYGGFSSGQVIIAENNLAGYLDNFLPPGDLRVRRRMYRDIYYHDVIAGSAVDLHAILPFSNFTLSGIKDRDVMDKYHRSVESLHLKSTLPAISRDYMVMGAFIGSTTFDSSQKVFTGLMPQNIDFTSIVEVPLAGIDPLINLRIPDNLIRLLKDTKDPRVANIVENLPDNIRNGLRSGEIPLQPENTLYIPRRTLSTDTTGTSYYERILPIYMMEKSMFRGSIDQIYRRQRAIMHVTVSADGEDYVASPEDLDNYRDLFLQADRDPTGAIIVTRGGVQPNEIRDAGQFFRIDEMFEFFSGAKYRGLNINEAFVSGDASFSTLDASMSIFIEQIRSYREMLTREIFYQKIFPAIAVANEFRKDRYMVTGRAARNVTRKYIRGSASRGYRAYCDDTRHGVNFFGHDVDLNDLALPNIIWDKHLKPEGDDAYLTMLQTATQLGLPVPIGAMASAAGLNLDAILNGMDDEIKIRKKLDAYNKKIAKYMPQQDDGSGGGDYQAQASEAAIAGLLGQGSLKPIGLLGREYDERLLPHNTSKTGKYRHTTQRQAKHMLERQNRVIAAVAAEHAKKSNRKLRDKMKENPKVMSSKKYGIIK